MDKIHAMQLFMRVADLESFSRAAETLALPKGSVSADSGPGKPSWRAAPAPHYPPGSAHPGWDGLL